MESKIQDHNMQDSPMDTASHGILQSGEPIKKKDKSMKPHVTWDEEQIAEHDKTRGQKMKIDEPKTPYVTEEEFRKLCEEDPDWQESEEKEKIEMQNKIINMGNIQNIDINSQEAQKDDYNEAVMSDEGMQDFRPGQQVALSDDETAISPMKLKDDNLLAIDQQAYFQKQQFAKSSKKSCESSMNVFQKMEANGLGGGSGGQGLDFSKLEGKLQEINDDEEDAAAKKKAFDEKRKKHYANEFQMAQLLRQKQEEMEEDDDEDEKE